MRRLGVSVVLACLAVLGLAIPAFAHDVVVGGDPARGAQLSVAPTEVRLDFNAPVQDGPNIITVIGPHGGHWERTENATVNGNSVSVPLAPLGPAGQYTIGYRVVSADGHPVQGEVPFTMTTVGTGTPVSAGGSDIGTASGTSGGTSIWPWLVGAVVLLGVALFFAFRITRKTETAA
jgi:methionine-rich copper-binding protein CopC